MELNSKKFMTSYQYGLLAVLIMLGTSMGFWQEIITPTLPNLSVKLNVSYNRIGIIMSIRSVGNVFALIFSAMLYDTFPHLVHYFMFLECLIGGITTIIIPWCSKYWLVALFFFIQSGCQNALNNGGQLYILGTFQERSVGKMQLYHLGYGIGGVISGLVSQAFLPKQKSSEVKLTRYCIKMGQSTNISSISNMTRRVITNNQRFEYIYLIAGIFAISSACIFLLFKILCNPTKNVVKKKEAESWIKKLNPDYMANGKVCYCSTMTTLLFLYYFLYIFSIVTFLPYIVVYAIDPCKSYFMSQRTATYLHTALNICFLIGRIIGSIILEFNPTMSLLIINIMNLLCNFILVFFSHKYALALWFGACGMRLFNSIVYPSGTSYVNRYIVVSSSLISLAFLGDTFGAFAGASLGGYLVDNYPSNYITYGCCGGMIIFTIIVITIILLGKKHGLRDFSRIQSIPESQKIQLY